MCLHQFYKLVNVYIVSKVYEFTNLNRITSVHVYTDNATFDSGSE